MSTQRQRNAAQVSEGYFSSSEMMQESAKAFQVKEHSFKAAHVDSTSKEMMHKSAPAK
jgi:hypothetical protein